MTLIASLLLVSLTAGALCQEGSSSYVPLNSLTISALLKNNKTSGNNDLASVESEREYKPWWNSLQEERSKRRRNKLKLKQEQKTGPAEIPG